MLITKPFVDFTRVGIIVSPLTSLILKHAGEPTKKISSTYQLKCTWIVQNLFQLLTSARFENEALCVLH
jgi:hypothetical protein